jgi:hypothetical protein
MGSFGNIVRNNVIHTTTIGMQYPCIFVYGGGNGINIVEGNAMWNCGEAIQVVSDAVVRNNLILDSTLTGISAGPHAQVPQMRNVTIVNNTIYGNPTCLSIRWSGATNMVLANNATYCPGTTAVSASGLTGGSITVKSNYVEGGLSGASVDGSRFVSGGSAAAVFAGPAQMDFWPVPGSPLIGKADAAWTPPLDFNERTRASPFDVGAYETDGVAANPGWKVGPGFKRASGASSLPPAAHVTLRVSRTSRSSGCRIGDPGPRDDQLVVPGVRGRVALSGVLAGVVGEQPHLAVSGREVVAVRDVIARLVDLEP